MAERGAAPAGDASSAALPGGLGAPPYNGVATVEGPHFPKPQTWYGQVVLKDGVIVKVK